MSDDAQGLRRAALAAHARADFDLAAEVFRRILMTYPGTPEARDAVVYLTEGRRLPRDPMRVSEPPASERRLER
jgi:hypothetical protein